MQENKTVSITGGTGHLGACLINMLLDQNYIVNALYVTKKPTIEHPNLKWVQGDITKPRSFDQLLDNSSVLIHSAGMISIGEKEEQKVYNINVNGTENAIYACINQNVKMIYISSSAAVVETKNNEVYNEDRPYKTENDFTYDWTKATAEKIVLDSVKNKNLDALIIRPTAIIGPPDNKPSHFGQTILDMANYKMPIITTGGYNLVDVRDLSQTIINSIDKGTKGEVYLVGGSYYSIKEIAKISNPNRYFFCMPLGFLISMVPLINLYKKMFPLPWPITKESLITLKLAPKNMDCSKARIQLNHNERPITETINDLLIWFKKN